MNLWLTNHAAEGLSIGTKDDRFDLVVSLEEHNIVGGFGGAVAEVMAEMREKSASVTDRA